MALTPLRIAAIYALFGVLALYFSDVLLVAWVEQGELVQTIQLVKGGVEIAVTAVLIYVLTRSSERSLVRSNARLEQSKAELSVLHRLLRHNLRNAMNVVHGSARNLEETASETVGGTDVERIVRQSERVIRYCEHAKTIDKASGDSRSVGVEFDLSDLVSSVARAVPSGGADVRIDVPETAPVRANPELRAAVQEAVRNAISHAGRERPRVSIDVEALRESYELRVSDDGPGIPEMEGRALSNPEKPSLHHGSGLGLWMIWWVVRQSNGSLTIESTARGSTVCFGLPAA